MPRPSRSARWGTRTGVGWGRGTRVASAGKRGGERVGRLAGCGAHGGPERPARCEGAARHPSLPRGEAGPGDEQAQGEGRQPGRDGADGEPAHDAGGSLRDGQHPRRRQQRAEQPGSVLQQPGMAGQAKGCEAEQPVGVGAAGQQQQRPAPPHPAPPPDQPGHADQFQDAQRCRRQEQQRAVLDPAALKQVINLAGTVQEPPAQIGDQYQEATTTATRIVSATCRTYRARSGLARQVSTTRASMPSAP